MSVRFKILRVGATASRPASRDARRRGCTCPVEENRGGGEYHSSFMVAESDLIPYSTVVADPPVRLGLFWNGVGAKREQLTFWVLPNELPKGGVVQRF